MKSTSIAIPILIIGCLLALIYLFYAGLRATDDGGGTDTPIVLNPADYAKGDPQDTGENANLEPYFQEATEDEDEAGTINLGSTADADANANQVAGSGNSGSSTTTNGRSLSGSATNNGSPATTTNTNTARVTEQDGRFLVIAGSFRQLAGARDRVTALKTAGFADSRVERFNKGSFAVALAGQADRYSEANRLAGRIREAGFEVRVMRRR